MCHSKDLKVRIEDCSSSGHLAEKAGDSANAAAAAVVVVDGINRRRDLVARRADLRPLMVEVGLAKAAVTKPGPRLKRREDKAHTEWMSYQPHRLGEALRSLYRKYRPDA